MKRRYIHIGYIHPYIHIASYNTRKPIIPLVGTLKPPSGGPLYRNTVIGTLDVDGWAVILGTASMGLRGLRTRLDPFSLYATAYPSTVSVPTSYYSMSHYNYLCTLKG